MLDSPMDAQMRDIVFVHAVSAGIRAAAAAVVAEPLNADAVNQLRMQLLAAEQARAALDRLDVTDDPTAVPGPTAAVSDAVTEASAR